MNHKQRLFCSLLSLCRTDSGEDGDGGGVAAASPCFPTNDIGLAVDKASRLSDADRVALLKPWQPPPGFRWPFSERKIGDGTRRDYLGPQYVRGLYECFAYSVAKQGLFCKTCVLFGVTEAGGVPVDRLVRSPLQVYARLTGKRGLLTSHMSNHYHIGSMQRAQQFHKQRAAGVTVLDLQDKAAAAERNKNQLALKRILRCIEHLGRLGEPLRGHRDSGVLNVDEQANYQEGNFRATLHLMTECGDSVLREHLTSGCKNATYISPNSQNSLINAIDAVLRRSIADEVRAAEYFTLLADETTDVSGKEQLSICLRYVLNGTVRERLLAFEEAPDLTGAGLAAQLLATLRANGIDISTMVGQGYDGAAAMSGEMNGVQKHVQDACPQACYSHCASHALNLCLVHAAKIREVQATATTMTAVTNFFNESNKRLAILQASIAKKCDESSRTRLKKRSETRWVENQEASEVFRELLPAVVDGLEVVSCGTDRNAVGKATVYLDSVVSPTFRLCLEIICKVLSVTKPLSVKLQTMNQDLLQAVRSVDSCMEVLQSMRDGDTYDKLFNLINEETEDGVKLPRRTGKQTHRSNPPANDAREYFRRSVFLPFVDTCLHQLRERFKSHRSRGVLLCSLLPSVCVGRSFADAQDGVTHYNPFMDASMNEVHAEFLRWQEFWGNVAEEERPDNVLSAMSEAETMGTFPCMKKLLHIYATLHVTTATNERCFSALKYLKNYLRSTMSQHRLNGLALLYLNRDIALNYDDVLEEFGRGNRRLTFK